MRCRSFPRLHNFLVAPATVFPRVLRKEWPGPYMWPVWLPSVQFCWLTVLQLHSFALMSCLLDRVIAVRPFAFSELLRSFFPCEMGMSSVNHCKMIDRKFNKESQSDILSRTCSIQHIQIWHLLSLNMYPLVIKHAWLKNPRTKRISFSWEHH